jgi:pyruvate decarboxylase
VPLTRTHLPNDPNIEKFILDEIVKLVEEADGDVIILVDACAIRHDVRKEVFELAQKTGFPVYSAPMGKTAVSERYERYGGVST